MNGAGIVLVHRVRGYAQYSHSTSFGDYPSMKHVNAEQERRLSDLANAARSQRAAYLNGLSEYLQQRTQLVSEYQNHLLSLSELGTQLKEARENYLRTTQNPIH